MNNRLKYRLSLLAMVLILLALASGVYYKVCQERLPDQIQLAIRQSSEFNYKIPAIGIISTGSDKKESVNMKSKFVLKTAQKGDYTMETRLFGFIKLKEVAIEALERQKAAPSGEITGIYIETDGLFVIDTTDIETKDGAKSPAKDKLKSGDYIVKINNRNASTKLNFLEEINHSRGKTVSLYVMRKGKKRMVRLKPVLDKNDDQYKIGAYIRNNTQGIGTITYTQGNKFAALGHGISDIDLGDLLSIKGGEIYQSEISTIKKGKPGSPGEIVGMIDYKDEYRKGTIERNSENGIFGTYLSGKHAEKKIPVALKQEVKTGKARIISCISGKKESYEIEITHVDNGNHEKLKGMSIKVTDKKLKNMTNGIVQGMSGSPIIQDGKLVGAVTHVFVSDPAKGYAIFAETMLDEQK